MMREEFISLANIEVTAKYYEEIIEPKYTEMNVDKETFVQQWLKDNKANIVKAHAFDIDRASRELALADYKAEELEKVKAENKRLQEQAETFETKFKAANSSWQEASRIAESWKTDYHEARKQAEQVDPLRKCISELENEVIKLKARLFDMMEEKAAAAVATQTAAKGT